MSDQKQAIKDIVLSRLRQNSDFPAMSNTINSLNQYKSLDDVTISELANVILRDYALTSKILKLVNSVHYAQFGEVTTISRAINLLGFENIKNLAVTLILFDHLQKHTSNTECINSILKSFFSAIMAHKIAADTNFADREESFICALFHAFGKMMVAFSMPEKIDEINLFCKERNVLEDVAAVAILGISFKEIGMTIAREWNFPSQIVQSMNTLRSAEITKNPGDTDKLISISTLSNEISRILSGDLDKKKKDEKLDKLLESFQDHFGALKGKMPGIIVSSMEALNEYSTILNLTLQNIPFTTQVLQWAGAPGVSDAGAVNMMPFEFETDSLKTIDTMLEDNKENLPEGIFTKGIQDTNSAIMSNAPINDLVRIVLETMYRGMQLSGQSKALFFIKDPKLSAMNVRFGFGNGIEQIKKWFNITISESGDIFNMTIRKQTDIVVKDISAPDVSSMFPKWYVEKVSPNIFIILLPIIINKKPIGMFYVEGEKEGFQKISGMHLNYLKILRDQTVMAIKQKQGY